MSDSTCPMCGAAVMAAGKCPSSGENIAPKDGKRRAQLPMFPPIETIILYPILLTAVAVSLLLPLVGWLRQLLRGF